MNTYKPDAWVLIKFTKNSEEPVYKILAGWYGGYLSGDSWRLCSGIDRVNLKGSTYEVSNYSGSMYYCDPEVENLTGLTSAILAGWESKAKQCVDFIVKIEVVTMRSYLANF
jgi:hypothetical protein